MPNSRIISRRMDTVGDGSGTKAVLNANDDLTYYYFTPDADQQVEIQRVIIGIIDGGSIDSGGYGNGSALTNGIELYVERDGSPLYYLTDPDFPIKTNGQWATMCHDLVLHTWGSGDQVLTSRWTFGKSGKPVYLNGGKSERLVLKTSDTLSQLEDHSFLLQGYYISPGANGPVLP